MAFPIKATIALTRIGAGVLTYAKPELSAKLFGIKGGDLSSAYTARLFGSRDIALGLAVLSPNPAVRRNALRLGILVDSADCAAAVLEHQKDDKLTKFGSALLVGGAAAIVVLGVIALAQEH